MTDRIFVTDLCLHGHHGVFPEENRLGQKFYVDIDCRSDFTECAGSDDYRSAVCYGTLCDIAADVSAAQTFSLIETLADRIASGILTRFPSVIDVRVRIRKPAAPLARVVEHVGVEVLRKQGRGVGPRDAAASETSALGTLARVEAVT